ncbi:hypothetical protein LCGC14_0832850 [marine sediment metagenome]|uniref:Uncharacterized protein n=1 Tax=marine sediment metagenome TaxID=412755 RepID=A0A0F9PFG3_9ZZZZ|nr:hypothetical protein [archaeon]
MKEENEGKIENREFEKVIFQILEKAVLKSFTGKCDVFLKEQEEFVTFKMLKKFSDDNVVEPEYRISFN